VFILEYQHRYSKDIDIFLRDPQFIGHISEIAPIIREYRPLLESRVEKHRAVLQEEYEALDLIDSRKTLDDCIVALERALRL
jgi:hypothetical protein